MEPTDKPDTPNEGERSGQPIHIAVESDDTVETNPVGEVIQPQADTSTPESEEVFVAPGHGTTIEIEPSLEDSYGASQEEAKGVESPEPIATEVEVASAPVEPEPTEAVEPSEPTPEPITPPASPAPDGLSTEVESNSPSLAAGDVMGAPPSEAAKPLFSPDNPAQVPPAVPAVPPKGKKKLLVAIAGVLASLLVLGGGFAAAYFAVYLPNKPENVLRMAIANTAMQTEISAKGELDFKAADPQSGAAGDTFKVNFDSKNNIEKKQSEIALKYTSAGVDFPIEVRYVDKSAYVKIGDLSTIVSLAKGYAASAGIDITTYEPLIKDVSGLLSDQWIEFDSTLLDSADLRCTLDADYTFTEDDVRLLDELFAQKPFAKIDSHSNDTVNGKSAIKYEISVDDDKLAKFVEDKKLENLSIVKAMNKCLDSEDESPLGDAGDSLADGDTTPITLWVDKNEKLITQFTVKSTEQDAKEDNLEGTIRVTLSYESVSVNKPEDAKPAMEVWGQLQEKLAPFFGPFFGGMDGMTSEFDDAEFNELDIEDGGEFDSTDFEDFEIQ